MAISSADGAGGLSSMGSSAKSRSGKPSGKTGGSALGLGGSSTAVLPLDHSSVESSTAGGSGGGGGAFSANCRMRAARSPSTRASSSRKAWSTRGMSEAAGAASSPSPRDGLTPEPLPTPPAEGWAGPASSAEPAPDDSDCMREVRSMSSVASSSSWAGGSSPLASWTDLAGACRLLRMYAAQAMTAPLTPTPSLTMFGSALTATPDDAAIARVERPRINVIAASAADATRGATARAKEAGPPGWAGAILISGDALWPRG
mmetsp:Transcript_7875/g.25790  ORF Transcript_7875/g.25790 Transcript_7875/m.25790 type:complete len:260 (-) Transcript_7875:182-961(-)